MCGIPGIIPITPMIAPVTTSGSGNAITQTGSGVITAATLNLTTSGGDATLDTASNVVTNLGAVSLGAGKLSLLAAGGLTVSGAVAATGGVLAGRNVGLDRVG